MAYALRKVQSWFLEHRSERGASLVEYALLVALIALVCIAAIGLLGGAASSSYNETGSSVAAAN